MKILPAFAVCVASVIAGAQTPTVNQLPHIRTALNHFTVIDPSESITMYAIADHSSFDIERRGDKLFLEPLRGDVATNLFVWTSSRELVFEVDPAGEVAQMNMLIQCPPAPGHGARAATATPSPDDSAVQKLTSLALVKAMIGSETIKNDGQPPRQGDVTVRLEEVFRSNGEMYVRYSISNLSKSLYRITAPDVYQPVATQIPISILSLRNHQLTDQTFASFKAAHGAIAPVIHSEVPVQDLGPGQVATGVLSVRDGGTNLPQLYQFNFGAIDDRLLTVHAVL